MSHPDTIQFYVYTASGKIMEAGNALPSEITGYPSSLFIGYGEANPELHYVDFNTGEVLPLRTMEPTFSAYDGHTYGKTVSDLPLPCRIRIDADAWIDVADGEAEIDFGVAGTYRVTIEADTYFDYQSDVTV